MAQQERIPNRQARRPEFEPQEPHEKPDGVEYVCNPSTLMVRWEAETGELPGSPHAGQLAWKTQRRREALLASTGCKVRTDS